MHLNPNGVGQVLVYPYYTVNNGYATFLTITNTTSQGKAIKVRLLEGYNGRDVQDFNLYLSPTDYWVGAVVDYGNGGAAIFTNDNSCTVPKLPRTSATALALTTANFDGSAAQGKDGGPTGVSRTREGHIEIIEMGTVTGPSATLSAITHVQGVPADCASIVNAWAGGGQWVADSTKDIGLPTGGLVGNGMVLNVANGTVFSYGADAIAQFYVKDGRGEHSRPDSLTPNISSATSLTANVLTDDGPLALTYARSTDAVSALFMAEKIQNEYWTSQSIGATSEWVITYPTKRFYVDANAAGGFVSEQSLFDSRFSALGGGIAPSRVAVKFWNREEAKASTEDGCGFLCPGRNPDPNLAYETQVITFNQNPNILSGPRDVTPAPPSRILRSSLVPMNIATSSATDISGSDIFQADNGWAEALLRLQYNVVAGGSVDKHVLAPATNGNILVGQPVAGFWINQLVNGDAGGKGVLANYTALQRHKLRATCMRTDNAPCS